MSEKESFRCKLVTYDEIVEWTRDLAKKIRACDCKPTVIIGLTRGGWVPARLLCDLLGVKKLYAVKTEHWGVTANPDGKALLTQELNARIDDEEVLLVDDITDTGESMSIAKAHLQDMRPGVLKTAALLHITRSTFVPDFYSVEVPADGWTWFIFPWNRNEDLRTLLPKTLYEEKGEADIQKAFREQFQIDVPLEDIRTTLEDLEAAGTVTRAGEKWTRA
ncbi:phosphoribosyltransferase [Methanomassiliicoccales archaeon RumEn M1]|jgi:hypoxanthine phosphoribosyltransferase|nr:phosphoribosyltransferase [Methanomassiliicoccales archaeon RumEn M1]